jgi:DNA-binding GntR family transcriptional regulator
MTFSDTANLSQRIADHIIEKIICMEYRPGERVMEAGIAAELGVSRSPVREALRILEKYRLVELIPRRGARVTQLSGTQIGHLCDVLTALFCLMVRQCVENATAKQLTAIDAAAERSRNCVSDGDVYGYYSALFDFALATLRAARNPLLEQLVQDLLPNVRRVIYASFSSRKGEALEKNVSVVMAGNRCLQARNGEMAEKILVAYIDKARQFAQKNDIFPGT